MQHSTLGAAFVALLLASGSAAYAQQPTPTLANSTQILKDAVAQHDQGNYAAAIAQYLTVPASDTSYARVQSELALSYLANEQYAEAAAAARRAIELHHHDAQPYNIAATAEENLDHKPAALKLYAEGLRLFPYSQALWYNQAITQDESGDTKASLASLMRSLELAPLHAGTHYYLGYLAMRQGHTAQALISVLTSLSLDPVGDRSNSRLVVAEQLASGTVQIDGKEKLASMMPNAAFQELDELINSKVALRKDYTTKVKFDANVVKQAQLLLEKFPAADADATDPWLRIYSPLVAALRRDDNLTAFTYLVLSSAKDNRGAQWVKSNKSRAEKMGTAGSAALRELRQTQPLVRDGKTLRVKGWFNDDGQLAGLGEGEITPAKTTLRGPWLMVDEAGALTAEGAFSDAGLHTGTWRYYHDNGQLRKLETYDADGKLHGPFTEYHDNGALSIEANYVHGKAQGPAKIHSYCGTLNEVRPFKDDVIEGEAVFYYPDGRELGRTAYKADKRDGHDLNYYPDGKLEAEYDFVADLKQGPFAVYYADKVLEKKGSYDKGELHGLYTSYFANGQVEQTGTYDHGKSTGQWREYYRTGKPSTEISYNAAGDLHGKYLDYDNSGVLSSEFLYDQGRVTQMTYFDKAGKVVAKTDIKKGKMPVQAQHLSTGKPRYTGTYLNGLKEGEWRWFYPDGTLQTVRHFVAGKLNGLGEDYFSTGSLKARQNYTADQADGYMEAHYVDGPLRQTGFYQHGQQQGLWRDYYVDGRVSEEFYYRDGNMEGPARSYTPLGKLTGERQFANDRLQLTTSLDSTGKEIGRLVVTPETKEMTFSYPGGKPRYRMPMLCYNEHGTGGWISPTGAPESTFSTQQGRREGLYKTYGPTGKLAVEGQYRRGNREGIWKSYYPSGALQSQGEYRNNNVEGEWTSYFENGKPETVVQYVEGTMHGTNRYYNMLGELLVEKRYEEGQLTGFRAPGPDGKASGDFQAFSASGPLKTQFANGKPASDETYRGAYWEGPRTYYYSTGQVYRRAQNKGGVLTGKLETFYPDGKLQEEEYYLHDELHGRCRYYRPDGTLEREESFRSGERYGPTVYYNAQGKPVKTDFYWNAYVYASK